MSTRPVILAMIALLGAGCSSGNIGSPVPDAGDQDAVDANGGAEEGSDQGADEGEVPDDGGDVTDEGEQPDGGEPADGGDQGGDEEQPAAGWQSRGVGGGGALFVPEVSPFDEQIYMATDMGAVFHSSDLGQTWSTIDFRKLRGGAFAQVRFAASADTLFAIPYIDDNGTQAPHVSRDAGATFIPLGDGSLSPYYLEVDPESTERLLASDWLTLYFSSDAGQTFRPVYTGTNGGGGLILAGAFWAGQEIVVGTNDGLVVSHDGGQTFALEDHGGFGPGEAMLSFAGAGASGTTRFFAVTARGTSIWAGMQLCEAYWDYLGVYRLEVGDSSWTALTGAIPSSCNATAVRMATGDVEVAWLAGSDVNTGAPSVCRTQDGGASWESVFLTSQNANIATGWSGDGGDKAWWFGECAEGFAVSRADPDRAVLTDMGFVHVTRDGGQSWHQAYVDPLDENPAGATTPKGKAYRTAGVEQTSGWWLTWAAPDTIFGSFTDITSVRSTDAGVSWARDSTNGLTENTTYQALLHPSGALYAVTSSVHDIYMSYRLADNPLDGGTGALMQSVDQGATWTEVHDFGHPAVFLALDPSDPSSVYVSVVDSVQGGIYHTAEIGQGAAAQWSRLASPPRTEGHPYNIAVLDDGTLVATFSGRRTTAFTDSAGVFVSSNGGSSWEDRSDPRMHYWVKDLLVDPNDPTQDTWYVGVFQHWGAGGSTDEGGLYRTTDRGATWSQLWGGHNVESIAIDPGDPGHALVATDADGLWLTNDLGSATPTFVPDEDYPFAHPLRIFFNPHDPAEVWVASFGGGLRVWRP